VRILVVEDNRALAEAIVEILSDELYAADLAPDGATASELMAVNDYDLAVLDREIPPPKGLDLLREWRAAGITIPILMLTGLGEVEQKITGLDAGADDYLAKPFVFAELLARIRSLLRRRDKQLQAELTAGNLRLDRTTHTVFLGDDEIELSPKEYTLIEYLLVRKGEAVSRFEIEEHVWDSAFDSTTNVVDVLIHRLRRKIDHGHDGKLLHTVKGVGYRLSESRER
jgi:DNA-binding response OmpR family regulator